MNLSSSVRQNIGEENLRRGEQITDSADSDDAQSTTIPIQTDKRGKTLINLTRLFLVLFLLLSGGTLAWATYYFLSQETSSDYGERWASCAETVINGTNRNSKVMFASVSTMANLYPMTVADNQTGETLPFVTVPFFERFGMAARQLSNISSIVYCPVLFTDTERAAWVPYSVENQGWLSDSYSYYPGEEYDSPPQSIRTDVWDSRGVSADNTGPYLPSWQMTPPPFEAGNVVNFNHASLAGFYRMMQQVINSQAPLLSEPANFSSIAAFGAEASLAYGNTSILLLPVFDTLDLNVQGPVSVVGIMLAVIPWVAFFTNVLPTGQNGVVVVVESCGSNTSYLVNGPLVSVLGWGDWHDPKYSSLAYQAPLSSSFGNYTPSSDSDSRPDFYSCNHLLRVFPSDSTVSSLSASNDAASNPSSKTTSYAEDNIDVILTAVVASVFIFSAIVFLFYDRLVRSRQIDKQTAGGLETRLDDEREPLEDLERPHETPSPDSIGEDEDFPREDASERKESIILALVRYNSETLVDLVRQIVSNRNRSRQQSLLRESPRRILSESQASIDAVGMYIGNGGLVVDEALDVIAFPESKKPSSKNPRRASLTPLDPKVIDQIYMFIAIIAGLYRDENAFHNFEHSSQVALTLCKMLAQAESNVSSPPNSTESKRSISRPSKVDAMSSSKSLLRKSSTGSVEIDEEGDAGSNRLEGRSTNSRKSSNDSIDSYGFADDKAAGMDSGGSSMKEAELEEGISDEGLSVVVMDSSSYTQYLVGDPLVKFAMVLAALVHDLDHRGVPNDVLHTEEPTLSAAYRRRSVHEQNALEMSWSALFSEGLEDLRSVLFADVDDLQLFRRVLVNCVMATDIFDSDLQALREMRFRQAFRSPLPEEAASGADSDATGLRRRQATVAMEIMMQAADVAPTIQPWFLYTKWNERLYREAYDAYRSRRTLRDPSETWYWDEIDFFDSCSIPLASKLKECGVLGAPRAGEYVKYAEENRRQWVATGREIVARYVETYNSEGSSQDKPASDRSAPVSILRNNERRPSSKRYGVEDARSFSVSPSSADRKSVRINEV
jgi:hypothetical protein